MLGGSITLYMIGEEEEETSLYWILSSDGKDLYINKRAGVAGVILFWFTFMTVGENKKEGVDAETIDMLLNMQKSRETWLVLNCVDYIFLKVGLLQIIC